MRALLLTASLLLSMAAYGQIKKGFIKEEARDLIAIGNSYCFLDLYKTDTTIVPRGYAKIYTSEVLGMDNIYQIYQKGNTAVISLRGSTAKKISWLENIYSSMIPAKGKMVVEGKNFKYVFGNNPKSTVHAGYALELAFLSEDIVNQIAALNEKNIYNIIITGHSQGGALANLLRAYLEHLSSRKISKKNQFKTYAFAAPMVGNKEFAEEYNADYCLNNTSFNIINPEDHIPNFPLNYDEKNNLSKNLKTFLLDPESFQSKNVISDGLILLLEQNIAKSVNKFCSSVSEQIAKELGPFEMPPYVQNINYCRLNNLIQIDPVDFPKILKDSTLLQNGFYDAFYKKGENGEYISKRVYVKQPWSYQHKAYNYYTSIMKMYFPEEYELMEKKHLNEILK